jgi:hypothetical protein
MDVFTYAHRHHTLQVDHYSGEQALSTAIVAADHASDEGTEALAYIEVWEAGRLVRTLSRDEVWTEAEKYRSPLPKYDPPAADLQLQGHDGNWASECRYQTLEGAERAADRYRAIMGDERVRVKPLKAAPR